MHTYAEAYYRDRLLELVSPDTEWIELGCGRKLIAGWLKNSESDQRYLSSRCKRLVGIDAVADDVLRHPYLHERTVGDLLRLPFQDNSFSLSTARCVIEHIAEPTLFLREVWRVLRPGGCFLFATPNFLYYQSFIAARVPNRLKKQLVWALERRPEHDIFPTYYRMNTRGKVMRLLPAVGLEIESVDTIECPPEFFRLGRPILELEKAITAAL